MGDPHTFLQRRFYSIIGSQTLTDDTFASLERDRSAREELATNWHLN